MPELFDDISRMLGLFLFSTFCASWIYAVLACQVLSGFPPFYVHRKRRDQPPGYAESSFNVMFSNFYLMLISGFLIVAGAVLENLIALGLSIFLGAVCAFLFGFRLRRFLMVQPSLQYPLIDMLRFRLPIFGEITNRYPMLVFDLWTIGNAALIFALTVLTQ